MTTTLKTRTKAPFVIVYVGRGEATAERLGLKPLPAEIVGYAYTLTAAQRRQAKLGRAYVIVAVEAGKATITEEPV